MLITRIMLPVSKNRNLDFQYFEKEAKLTFYSITYIILIYGYHVAKLINNRRGKYGYG